MGLYLSLVGTAAFVLGLAAGAVWLLWRRSALLRQSADAAARARAEQAVRDFQGHFHELLKGRKGYAVFTLDAAGLIQTWSPDAAELFGYSEAEARGRPLALVYPPTEASAGAHELHLLNARTGGRIDQTAWRVRRDGRTFRARAVLSARRDARGEVEGFWCLTEDLTGQNRSASCIMRADAALVAADSARDLMIGVAADGKISFLNRAFEKTTGFPRREWQGRSFTTLVHPGDWARVADLLKRLGEGQSPPSAPARLLAASDRHVAVELTATPLGPDGAPHGCLIMARPQAGRKGLAEARATDDRLLRSQKLEALGRLAGGVAHDFNNLLTVIIGYADLLGQYGPDDQAREVGREIQKAGERAAALTRQLLAFSRRQVLQPVVLDLNDLVRNIDAMLRRLIGEDVELATALHAAPLCVKADRGQLEQVLTNLVVNARDAMPKGGRLMISTAEVQDSAESAEAAEPRAYAMLTVADTGCGMDEQVLKRLFEPFFTTKEVGKGTGLGLAMAHGIMQQSGGRIEVESEPGRGSTFRVYLPLTDKPTDAADSAEPAPAAEAPGRGNETVLLVEDEEAVRQLARRALQAQGYNVLEACDGVAALHVCQRHLRAIDLVVTDVVMPQLGGVDLAERLKAIRPQLQVLFMSGYTDSAVARHGMEQSEANYLQKPFTPDLLTRKVRHLLDQAPQSI